MRKLWIIIALSAGTVMATWAGPLPEKQQWIEQGDGGFVLPLSRAASNGYAAGYGGDILVGYRFDRDFSLSADVGYFDCDQKVSGSSAGEWVYVPIMAVARMNFGPGPVRPYLLLGAGAAYNTYSLTPSYSGRVSKKETDLLLAPGLGVLFIVNGDTALYVQGRFDLNFASQSGPFTDTPTIFMPLKAGLSFFVL